MSYPSTEAIRTRLLTAFELFEAGLEMQKMRLRRAYPNETEEQHKARIRAWLQDEPGSNVVGPTPLAESES